MTRLVAVVACLVTVFAAQPASASTVVLFRLPDPRIVEASGIAPGAVSPAVAYVNNDSGDVNRVFAVNRANGATAAAITLAGATNVDYEDIATAPDPMGTPSVWVADIGDNTAIRPEVRMYRFTEPHLYSGSIGKTFSRSVDTWRLRYPAGPVNAESIAVSPLGRAFVATKARSGATRIYRVPPAPDASAVQRLEEIGSLQLGSAATGDTALARAPRLATGAALSADGTVFALRTYTTAYLWHVVDNNLRAALQTPPVRFALPLQPQGEGIAVAGARLLLDSEGMNSAVLAVSLPASFTSTPAAVTPGAGAAPVVPPAGSATAAVPTASGSDATSRWLVASVVAASFTALAALGWAVRSRGRVRRRRGAAKVGPSNRGKMTTCRSLPRVIRSA